MLPPVFILQESPIQDDPIFGGQANDAPVGWSDAISADPLMDLGAYQASFSVEFNQALNAHIASMIGDSISNHEVPERCYNAFRPCGAFSPVS